MRRNRLLLAATAASLMVASCAGTQTASPPAATMTAPTTTPTAAPTTAPTTAPATPTTVPTAAPATATATAAAEVTVQLAESELGQILVDVEGFTLYGFVPDEESGEPTCYDDCAVAWPPLAIETDFMVGPGLDEALFTTVERTDGAMQLKVGSFPLYYFAQDIVPGDMNGQGVGGAWYVVGADGELIGRQ